MINVNNQIQFFKRSTISNQQMIRDFVAKTITYEISISNHDNECRGWRYNL